MTNEELIKCLENKSKTEDISSCYFCPNRSACVGLSLKIMSNRLLGKEDYNGIV